MPILGFSRFDFQTGDQACFRIHTYVRFIAIEIFSLFFIFSIFSFYLALVLYTPPGIRIVGSLPFVLLFLFFICVDIRNTMNVIHNLDRSKLDTRFPTPFIQSLPVSLQIPSVFPAGLIAP